MSPGECIFPMSTKIYKQAEHEVTEEELLFASGLLGVIVRDVRSIPEP